VASAFSASDAGGRRSPPAGALEYRVLLKKPGKLGIEVNIADEKTLLIDLIEEGLVADWNAANPHNEVMVGHRIISVNGVAGDADRMTEECKSQEDLNMLIRIECETPAQS